MIHPMPPEGLQAGLLDLAKFLIAMVVTVVITGFAAWLWNQGVQP